MRLKTSLCVLALCASPLVASQELLNFDEGNQLMRERMCLGCHQIDKKRVGPAWIDVANRYGADGDIAIPMLMESIRKGGRGKWGAVPMPAQPQVSAQEAQALAVWILGLQQKPE